MATINLLGDPVRARAFDQHLLDWVWNSSIVLRVDECTAAREPFGAPAGRRDRSIEGSHAGILTRCHRGLGPDRINVMVERWNWLSTAQKVAGFLKLQLASPTLRYRW